jgi:hypothetical protein
MARIEGGIAHRPARRCRAGCADYQRNEPQYHRAQREQARAPLGPAAKRPQVHSAVTDPQHAAEALIAPDRTCAGGAREIKEFVRP